MKTNLISSLAIIGAVSIATVSFTNVNSSTYKTTAMKQGEPNTLSAAEKKAGWKLLFDGKSLNGWRAYQNKKTESWMAMEGVIHCRGSKEDKSDLRADLITDKQYENFDLSIDWKISPQGNSGIIYLATEQHKAAYETGPEYQLIDDLNFPQKLEDWQRTGANYAMDPAPTAQPNKVGEWNTTRIVVNKGHVEHWLNGKKIVEYQIGSEKWNKEKSTGKWKSAPDYGVAKKGHIALQDHGSEAWFRNVKIKEL